MILNSVRVVYSYNFYWALVAELGGRIHVVAPASGISSLIHAATDNKAYYTKTDEKHSEEGHEVLQTANWLTSNIPLMPQSPARPRGHNIPPPSD